MLRELYSKMQGCGLVPRTVVCYEREAFLYAPGRVRITLDRDLRTGIGPLDFLRPERLCLRPLEGLTIWRSSTMNFCQTWSAWLSGFRTVWLAPVPNTPCAAGLTKQ